MKLINAGLKSEKEMALFLVGGGRLYIEHAVFLYDHSETVDGYSGFILRARNGKRSPIEEYWGNFSEMEKEATLKDAIKSGKKIPCWTDRHKMHTCLIVSWSADDKGFHGSKGEFFSSPIPIEAEELL